MIDTRLWMTLAVAVLVCFAPPVTAQQSTGEGYDLEVYEPTSGLNDVEATSGSQVTYRLRFTTNSTTNGTCGAVGVTPNACGSYNIRVEWNAAVLSYNSHTDTAPSGWSSDVDTASGQLDVSAYGASAAPDPADVLDITFDVVGTAGDSTALTITDISGSEMFGDTGGNDLCGTFDAAPGPGSTGDGDYYDVLYEGQVDVVDKWSQNYGGGSDDSYRAVQKTSDGGYIVAGYESSWGFGASDAWLMKLDADGNKVWSKTYGGSGSDSFRDVQQTSDGGYIVVGDQASWGQGGYDGWVMRLDSAGAKVWAKTLGGTSDDSFRAVRETSDGGYIVAGGESSWGQGGYDGWVMKLNASGGKVWAKTFGGSSDDSFRDVWETSDGGFIVVGEEGSWGFGGDDGWVMRLDSTGAKVWAKNFGGSMTDSFRAVQETSDGGYLVAGHESSWGFGGYDGWVMKLGSDGSRTWAHNLGGSSTDSLRAVDQTSDGGYVLFGYEESWGFGGRDGWIVRLNSSGGTTWSKNYGGASGDYLFSGEQTDDGGFVAAGQEASWGLGLSDGWIVKTGISGGV